MAVHLFQKFVQCIFKATIRITGNEYTLFYPCCHKFIPRTLCHDLKRSKEKRVQEKNNKNHQPKLMLVTTKQMRLSQTLLLYEVFAFTSVKAWLESAYPSLIYFPSKANITPIHLRAKCNGNLQREKLGIVPFSLQWIQKAWKHTFLKHRLRLTEFGKL